MPVSYEIDPRRNRITTRCIGDTTLSEVLEHFDLLEREPNRPPHLDVLLDLTEQTNLPTAQQIQAAASRIGMAKWMIDFRACAIVVNRDALFGMLRMFEVFAHPHFERLRVFRDMSQARTWLESRNGSGLGSGNGNGNPRETQPPSAA
ncbi:MAG TPA: hypothetical protein VGH97_10815 [Thermoanaerobaculia bacterium]|jgi:hypothetical protein